MVLTRSIYLYILLQLKSHKLRLLRALEQSHHPKTPFISLLWFIYFIKNIFFQEIHLIILFLTPTIRCNQEMTNIGHRWWYIVNRLSNNSPTQLIVNFFTRKSNLYIGLSSKSVEYFVSDDNRTFCCCHCQFRCFKALLWNIYIQTVSSVPGQDMNCHRV